MGQVKILDAFRVNRIAAKMGFRSDVPVWADDTILGALDAPGLSPAGSTQAALENGTGLVGLSSFTLERF